MNCCDYDRNQGESCPARVARVGGYRMVARDELPPETFRDNLPALGKWLLICFVLMFAAACSVGLFR